MFDSLSIEITENGPNTGTISYRDVGRIVLSIVLELYFFICHPIQYVHLHLLQLSLPIETSASHYCESKSASTIIRAQNIIIPKGYSSLALRSLSTLGRPGFFLRAFALPFATCDPLYACEQLKSFNPN